VSAGRCPGCGYEDASCRVVRSHMHGCSEVAVLFRERTTRALVIDPEDEYRRYREWLDSPEGQEFKAAERSVRDKAYRATFEAKIGRERARFGSRPMKTVESPPS
jgi:hypothetical protein